MKRIVTLCFLALAIVAFANPTYAQSKNKKTAVRLDMPAKNLKIYDPNRDAMKDIDNAVKEAANTNRYVLCQLGGNWCPWCLKFIDFVNHDEEISQFIKDNYVYMHVNYSSENRNPEVMKRLGNPARFGFPVFVILNEKGEAIHIQKSSYFEEDKNYNRKLVLEFLQDWTPKAVNKLI